VERRVRIKGGWAGMRLDQEKKDPRKLSYSFEKEDKREKGGGYLG